MLFFFLSIAYKAKVGIPTLVEKILKGQIQLEKLISHRIPLEKINEGFAMLKTGESYVFFYKIYFFVKEIT